MKNIMITITVKKSQILYFKIKNTNKCYVKFKISMNLVKLIKNR